MLKRFFLREENMLIAIILNALIIMALYFPSLENIGWLIALDHFFIFLFVLEAIVKIRTLGWLNYWAVDWNRFDFFIVLGSLPAVLADVLPIPDTSLLIILRLFRLLRLIRFLRFIPNMGGILKGLGRALKASVFVMLALFFLNLMLALVTCQFFRHTAPEYFGNPLLAAYSVFQLFTVEGWSQIADHVAMKYEYPAAIGFTRFAFVVMVLFGGIFGLSLANAVFVDEMTLDNNDELERKLDSMEKEIREIKQLLKERKG